MSKLEKSAVFLTATVLVPQAALMYVGYKQETQSRPDATLGSVALNAAVYTLEHDIMAFSKVAELFGGEPVYSVSPAIAPTDIRPVKSHI